MKRLFLLIACALLSSCSSPDYVLGALNNCIISGRVEDAVICFGYPNEGILDKSGNGSMYWGRRLQTTSISQKPINVYTNTTLQQSNFQPNAYKLTTRTYVDGGGISVQQHLHSCTLYMTIRDKQIVDYKYIRTGNDKLALQSSQFKIMTDMLHAARKGKLEKLKDYLTFIEPKKELLLRLAVTAARHKQRKTVNYLVNTYNLDVNEKVRTFIGKAEQGGLMEESYGRYEGHVIFQSINDAKNSNQNFNGGSAFYHGGIIGVFVSQQQS